MKTGYKLFLGFSIVIILLWVTVYFANVGGNSQGRTLRRVMQRRRGGAGRLADPSLAGEHGDAGHALLNNNRGG